MSDMWALPPRLVGPAAMGPAASFRGTDELKSVIPGTGGYRIRSRACHPTAPNSSSRFPTAISPEDSTFAITDLFAHMPPEAPAKNFLISDSSFDHIPKTERLSSRRRFCQFGTLL